ncbi:thioredoxin family protein [Candidatus Nomurabacteria bacterium]|nr:thioredoxin family protein [Candidatus Nomurabacteria bacterium]
MEQMMETKNKSANGLIITIVVLALIVIVALAFSGNKSNDENMMKDNMEQDSMMKDDAMEGENMMQKGEDKMMEDTSMKKEGDSMMAMVKGSYEIYSPEKLALANDGKVVLFFKASWCPTCKAVDADIKANLSSIPDNTNILTVDYDNSTDLKKKYGVTYQHTFVQVDATGNMIAKWSGSPTLASLVSNIK